MESPQVEKIGTPRKRKPSQTSLPTIYDTVVDFSENKSQIQDLKRKSSIDFARQLSRKQTLIDLVITSMVEEENEFKISQYVDILNDLYEEIKPMIQSIVNLWR